MLTRLEETGPIVPSAMHPFCLDTKARFTLAWAVCKATVILSRKDRIREAARGASLAAIVDCDRRRYPFEEFESDRSVARVRLKDQRNYVLLGGNVVVWNISCVLCAVAVLLI